MILLTSYVDFGYNMEINEKVFKGINHIASRVPHPLYVLTNLQRIDQIQVDYKILPYDRSIWSYVDKVYRSFKLAMETNQSVLYVDFNKFIKHQSIIYNEIPKPDHFLFHSHWDIHPTDLCRLKEWEPVRDYLRYKMVVCEELKPYLEEVFYIPRWEVSSDILKEIELFKPILEYSSYIGGYPYKSPNGKINVGNGEGVILSYLMERFKLPHSTF